MVSAATAAAAAKAAHRFAQTRRAYDDHAEWFTPTSRSRRAPETDVDRLLRSPWVKAAAARHPEISAVDLRRIVEAAAQATREEVRLPDGPLPVAVLGSWGEATAAAATVKTNPPPRPVDREAKYWSAERGVLNRVKQALPVEMYRERDHAVADVVNAVVVSMVAPEGFPPKPHSGAGYTADDLIWISHHMRDPRYQRMQDRAASLPSVFAGNAYLPVLLGAYQTQFETASSKIHGSYYSGLWYDIKRKPPKKPEELAAAYAQQWPRHMAFWEEQLKMVEAAAPYEAPTRALLTAMRRAADRAEAYQFTADDRQLLTAIYRDLGIPPAAVVHGLKRERWKQSDGTAAEQIEELEHELSVNAALARKARDDAQTRAAYADQDAARRAALLRSRWQAMGYDRNPPERLTTAIVERLVAGTGFTPKMRPGRGIRGSVRTELLWGEDWAFRGSAPTVDAAWRESLAGAGLKEAKR